MKKETFVKSVVFSITLVILFILISSAPAQAFILGLTVNHGEVMRGGLINFVASIKMTNEALGFDYLILKLKGSQEGPTEINCKFYPNGTILDVNQCPGISIRHTSSIQNYNSYGYNFYSYGTGQLEYNITLNTTEYIPTTYKTSIILVMPEKTLEEIGQDINIFAPNNTLKNCSLRGEDGIVKVDGRNFTDNKLSFYIPKDTARKGTGTITGQGYRDRFTYSFSINEGGSLENSKDRAIVLISGKYRLGRDAEKMQDAILILDKKNNKVSIYGRNITVENMVVTFKQGCDGAVK